MKDPAGLSTFQTQLALDRTTLAWIRTTLTMATFGFGMVTFFRSLQEQAPNAENARIHEGAVRFGTALIILGIVATVFAGISHWRALGRLKRGERLPLSRGPLSITLVALLAIMGLIGLWSLL